jgi:hypothetical protein
VGPSIGRPVCKRCATRMMLARIAPGAGNRETRFFECPNCDGVQVENVRTDQIGQCQGSLPTELGPYE